METATFFICFGLFIVMFAAIMLYGVRQSRARTESLAKLGFERLKTADATLADQVEQLYRASSSQRFKFTHVYRREISGAVLYVFDLEDHGRQESSTVGTGITGVYSPGMNLPYFILAPWSLNAANRTRSSHPYQPDTGQPAAGNVFARAAGGLIRWAMNKGGLEQMTVPGAPEFHQRYSVFGRDEVAILDFLEPQRTARLAAMERKYELVASGNFFTLKTGYSTDMKKAVDFATQADTVVNDAQKILQILS